MKQILGITLGVLIVFSLACNDKNTNSSETFSGVVITDEQGNLIGTNGDVDGEWCYPMASAVAKIPEPPVPTEFAFRPAYPNPCNGLITIWFDIPLQTEVTLYVNATSVKTVKHLLTNEDLPAGSHNYEWNLADDSDRQLDDGVYRVYMSTADFSCYGDIQILHPK